MIRVKMKICLAGSEVIKPGDVLDVPGPVAEEWIANGYAEEATAESEAERAEDKPKAEKATAKPRAEKATNRRKK